MRALARFPRASSSAPSPPPPEAHAVVGRARPKRMFRAGVMRKHVDAHIQLRCVAHDSCVECRDTEGDDRPIVANAAAAANFSGRVQGGANVWPRASLGSCAAPSRPRADIRSVFVRLPHAFRGTRRSSAPNRPHLVSYYSEKPLEEEASRRAQAHDVRIPTHQPRARTSCLSLTSALPDRKGTGEWRDNVNSWHDRAPSRWRLIARNVRRGLCLTAALAERQAAGDRRVRLTLRHAHTPSCWRLTAVVCARVELR